MTTVQSRAAVVAVFLLGACSASPLLHHNDESAPVPPRANSEKKPTDGSRCGIKSEALKTCAELSWQAGPGVSIESIAILKLTSSVPVTLSSLRLWMPDMGHSAGKPPTIVKLGPQTYLISGLFFFMSGNWDIEIYLQSEAQQDKITVPIKI